MKNYEDVESIMAITNHDKLSDKYSFVPTVAVINILERAGWLVSNAREQRSKVYEGFQKHIVRFRKEVDISRRLEIDEIVPEIILTNAHNGSARFILMSGFERCWCLNQCTVSESTIASHKITHVGFTQEKVMKAIDNIVEQTPKITDSITRFKDTPLTNEQRYYFASQALNLMFDNTKWDKYDKDATINRLTQPQRVQDEDVNLWNVFNIIQERFLKGGRYLVTKDEMILCAKYGWNVNYANTESVRPIKSIDRGIEVNRKLWELAVSVHDKIKIG
jgi:hypothetical protein